MSSIVYSKASLTQKLTGKSADIKGFGVKQLGIFGSFAKDAHIPGRIVGPKN